MGPRGPHVHPNASPYLRTAATLLPSMAERRVPRSAHWWVHDQAYFKNPKNHSFLCIVLVPGQGVAKQADPGKTRRYMPSLYTMRPNQSDCKAAQHMLLPRARVADRCGTVHKSAVAPAFEGIGGCLFCLLASCTFRTFPCPPASDGGASELFLRAMLLGSLLRLRNFEMAHSHRFSRLVQLGGGRFA